MKPANEKVIINNTQFRMLVTCLLWPTIIGYGAGMMAREAGRNMWLGGVLALLITALWALMLIHIGQKFPGRTMVQYSQQLLGTLLGKFIGLGMVLYFLLAANQSVSIYVHHINDFLLPETPFGVITVTHVLIVGFLVWQGPEVIARIGVIGFFMAIVFSSLVFLASLHEIDFHRVLPLLDVGLSAIGAATLTANSFVGQILPVIAMALPMVKEQKKAAGAALSGITVGGLICIFYILAELMVMGPHVTALMRVACMDLVRAIQITEYLHRFESFMVGLWYWSMLVQAGFLTYCATLACRQTMGLKEQNKWPVIAAGIIMIVLTYATAFNRVYFLNYLEHGWQYIALPVQLGLPLFLLFFSLFSKKQ